MVTILEERFKNVIQQSLTEPLASHGFRKRGRVFLKRLEDLSWLIEVQRDRYNTHASVGFTINCGIYVPHVLNLYAGLKEPAVPTSAYCCINTRIGTLAENHLDTWWTIESGTTAISDSRIINDVSDRINAHVLPFLNRFPTTHEAATLLEEPRRNGELWTAPGTEAMALGCAGIIRLIRGERESARLNLNRAVQTAMGTPGEEHLRNLEARLLTYE